MRSKLSIHPIDIQNISHLVNNNKIHQACDLLGEGLSGKVYTFDDYAVKVFKEDGEEKHDAALLRYLDQHPAFPKIHYRSDQFLVVDQVKGYTFAELRDGAGRLKQKYVDQVIKYVEECYHLGMIPQDLHLNNLMVDQNDSVKIIDVGRFFYTDNQQIYHDQLKEDMADFTYYCGFLDKFLGSSSRKGKKHRRRYRSSSSSGRRRYYSSSDRKRRYHSSLSSSYRKRRHRKYSSSS